MTTILLKTCSEPPFCRREALRYAGCRGEDDGIGAMLDACLAEARGALSYRVCWCELPVSIDGEVCCLGPLRLVSAGLAKNLAGCSRAILLAATVGAGIDRLIAKYGRLSPTKALMMQAIGAERIEALCDAFSEDIARETGMGQRPRFSPGYGDLALDAQREIFALLDCPRRIGLSLSDSLLMTPSKSVTAVIGLTDGAAKITNQCKLCSQTGCEYRRVT